MSKKEIQIGTLLKRYNKYSPELSKVDYHMDVLKFDAETLINRLSKDGIIDVSPDMSQEQLAEVILRLIKKCDANNPEYDSKIDEEMTRIGMSSDRPRYTDYRRVNGKNNNARLYSDDGSGVGGELPTQYEDYIDTQYQDGKAK